MDGITIRCKDCEFWKPIDSNGFGEIDTVFIDINCTNCTYFFHLFFPFIKEY